MCQIIQNIVAEEKLYFDKKKRFINLIKNVIANLW